MQRTIIRILGVCLIPCILIAGIMLFMASKKPDVQTEVKAEIETYKNDAQGFLVKYPKGFDKQEGNDGGYFDELNLYRLMISVPSGYQGDTDLNLANVNLLISPKTENCYAPEMTATRVIGNVTFRFNPNQPIHDAAMGGQRGYDSWFASIHNNQCFRIEKMIGYRDLRGFSEPPYKPHFDEAKANADLDAVIESFKFTTIVSETADWKTYKNEKHGFEIKYPPYFTQEPSGIPEEGTTFKNTKSELNIGTVFVGAQLSIKGPISFDEAAPEIKEYKPQDYEKGGTVRIVDNYTQNGRRIVTEESIGWPARIPGVVTIIENGTGSIELFTYGQKQINLEGLHNKDFSQFQEMEKLHKQMLSTLKFTK